MNFSEYIPLFYNYFNSNLNNLLLSLAVFSIILLILRETYIWLRCYFPSSVQCWFCHAKTKVKYELSNSWVCSSCEQYNGFTKDGDYNCEIPQQYDESLNSCITLIGRRKADWKELQIKLCNSCNRNQELMNRQLADFVPINDNSYDKEIKHFRNLLEKSYQLCSKCECLVSKIAPHRESKIPRKLNFSSTTPLAYHNKKFAQFSVLVSLLSITYGLSNLSVQVLRFVPLYNSLSSKLRGLSEFPIVDDLFEVCKHFGFSEGLIHWPIVLTFLGLITNLLQANSFPIHFLNVCSWCSLTLLTMISGVEQDTFYLAMIGCGMISLLSNIVLLMKPKKKVINMNNSTPQLKSCQSFKSSPISQLSEMDLSKKRSSTPIEKGPMRKSWLGPPRESSQDTLNVGISNLHLGSPSPPCSASKRPPLNQSKSSSFFLTPPKFNPNQSVLSSKTFPSSSSNSSGFASLDRSPSPSLYESDFCPYGNFEYVHPYGGYVPSVYSVSPALSPVSLYHFASQYQRLWQPPQSTPQQNPVPCSNSDNSLFLRSLYVVPMIILMFSNALLLISVFFKGELVK